MTKMYVANATPQNHNFIYRLPGKIDYIRQNIPAGGQVQLSGDLTTMEIDAVVEQHAPYGLVSAREVDRTKPFAGLCYALDKPVQLGKIESLIEHNREVMTERGRQLRTEAALAVNERVENELFERQMPDTVRSLEMHVEEISRGQRGDDSPEFNEGVRVTREGEPGGTPSPARGGRRRR